MQAYLQSLHKGAFLAREVPKAIWPKDNIPHVLALSNDLPGYAAHAGLVPAIHAGLALISHHARYSQEGVTIRSFLDEKMHADPDAVTRLALEDIYSNLPGRTGAFEYLAESLDKSCRGTLWLAQDAALAVLLHTPADSFQGDAAVGFCKKEILEEPLILFSYAARTLIAANGVLTQNIWGIINAVASNLEAVARENTDGYRLGSTTLLSILPSVSPLRCDVEQSISRKILIDSRHCDQNIVRQAVLFGLHFLEVAPDPAGTPRRIVRDIVSEHLPLLEKRDRRLAKSLLTQNDIQAQARLKDVIRNERKTLWNGLAEDYRGPAPSAPFSTSLGKLPKPTLEPAAGAVYH